MGKKKLTNNQIADMLEEIGLAYKAEGVRFKPQAFEYAAQTVRSASDDLSFMYKKCGIKCIDDLPGIGKSIAELIEEAVTNGKMKDYDRMKKKYPVDILGISKIQGVGAKTAVELYKKLGIKTMSQLQKAAKSGKLSKIKGFGKKTEQKILEGIGFLNEHKGRFLIHEAYPEAMKVIEEIKKDNLVKGAKLSGSIARMKETVGDIDLIVGSKKPSETINRIKNFNLVSKVFQEGSNKILVRLNKGIDCDVVVVKPDEMGGAGTYFSSSKHHAVELRKIAIKKKMTLTDKGLFKGKKKIAGKSDEEIYKALGLQYIPPELREWPDIISLAKGRKIPKLIGYNDVKGDLQVQTTWSDGEATIEEMAKTAKENGLSYIAITDHTSMFKMMDGLDGKKLRKQAEEIKKLNKKMKGFRILRSVECDVDKNGKLDLPDEALKKLDIVSASVHFNRNMSESEMTQRVIKVIKHPLVNILFHPTGRIVNKRAPYKLDVSKVIKAAKQYKVALEVNGSNRLDLKDSYVREAVENGVKLVVNTDAHAPGELGNLIYGIGQARRGFAKKSDVLNTKSASELLKALKK